eukprot:2740728-Prymnesium_polylepis.1
MGRLPSSDDNAGSSARNASTTPHNAKTPLSSRRFQRRLRTLRSSSSRARCSACSARARRYRMRSLSLYSPLVAALEGKPHTWRSSARGSGRNAQS